MKGKYKRDRHKREKYKRVRKDYIESYRYGEPVHKQILKIYRREEV